MKKWRVSLLVVAALTAVMTACQPAASGPQITVEGVWGRTSPMVADAGAFYLIIKNTGSAPDKLIGAKSDACGMTELHETVAGSGGVMEMRPVAGQSIEIPAGGSVELKPGGLHVMCMMKKADFNAGDKIRVTLTFEKSGEKVVDAEIRSQ